MKSSYISNYRRSNAISSVDFPVSLLARTAVKNLMQRSSAEGRQKVGQELLDELSSSAGIEAVKLKVSATRQYHKKIEGRVVLRQYGYYRFKSCYLYIQNQTPIRGQDMAPKTFFDTLMHEWMHHYDYYGLRIASIHTKGFYLRLKDLKLKLTN